MKKVISLILALAICLSLCACGKSEGCTCDCAQCTDCEKKTQTNGITDVAPADNIPENTEQNNSVIKFDTPIIVAEDQNMRVELVKFYEEPRLWKKDYPYAADSTTEGATLEKFVVFKFFNKTDLTLNIQLEDIYLGSDGAILFNKGSSEDIAAGKNVLVDYLIRSGEKETLKSMDELYSLDGNFYILQKGNDGVLRNGYSLNFSIPDGMNGGNAASISETATLKNSIYLGRWKVTKIKFAYDVPLENDFTDEEWEYFFDAMLETFDNVYLDFAETGECYYHTETKTTTGQWRDTQTGVQAGGMVFIAEGNKLISERDGYLLFWEKVSYSQTVPET